MKSVPITEEFIRDIVTGLERDLRAAMARGQKADATFKRMIKHTTQPGDEYESFEIGTGMAFELHIAPDSIEERWHP